MEREPRLEPNGGSGEADHWRDVECYDDLELGDRVVARANDVEIPAGARGVVLRRVEETGNWLVRFDLDGGERLVALCPWQVRPEAAARASRRRRRTVGAEQARRMTEPEVRERAIAGTRRFHERRRREIEESGARRCGRCGEELPLSAFSLRRQASGHVGYQAYCRACTTASRREKRTAKQGSG